MLVSLAALALVALDPAPVAAPAAGQAPAAPVASASDGNLAGAGIRRQLAEEGTDFAVPLDWAGPAARMPGADQSVQEFDPAASLFGENSGMCVVQPGQPLPPCAQAVDAEGRPNREVALSDDIFVGGISNPDATCQTIETIRRGANGQPERVFATVCGDEAEMWNYRQRTTPSSGQNPTRPTDRAIGPNDVTAPRNPTGN